jgi:hypothetical protein
MIDVKERYPRDAPHGAPSEHAHKMGEMPEMYTTPSPAGHGVDVASLGRKYVVHRARHRYDIRQGPPIVEPVSQFEIHEYEDAQAEPVWRYVTRPRRVIESVPGTPPITANNYEFVNLRKPRLQTRQRFNQLVESWRNETGWLSSVQQKVMHASYQRIIGMGPEALPLIFEQLRDRTEYWFWALAAITGEDPATGRQKMAAARSAWLSWASEHGY